jgi:glycosyltransferase involved in cell wall biosynthesis
MRVAIDATPLLLRSAGVKNYLYHWILALQQSAGSHSAEPFPPMGELGVLTHEASTISSIATLPRLAFLYFSNLVSGLPLNWLARRADVFHATNQIRTTVTGVALTATLHDMTCWVMPEFHTPDNVRADKSFAERTLKRADGLIAVSENTRRDAIEMLGLAPEKVTTIHSGVAPEFFETPREDVRAKYDLVKPYVLFVGTLEPRKNLDRLLEAWGQMKLRDEFDLVVAGPVGWAAPETLARVTKNARCLGYVPEHDLPSLTYHATLFACTSLYEGFGFPVAQAMACGVPVLTSNTSCLPEISGDGALHVDPKSPAEIRAGLVRLLESETLRRELGANGKRLAQRYRWERCAAESWKFFERVAG